MELLSIFLLALFMPLLAHANDKIVFYQPEQIHIALGGIVISFVKRAIPGLLFFIFVFSIRLTLNKSFMINFVHDWIWTADLWYRKWLLY